MEISLREVNRAVAMVVLVKGEQAMPAVARDVFD